jgi:DNA mismatch repair protein MutS
VKPHIDDSFEINIVKGRHPVIEQTVENGLFISNDTYINNDDQSMLLITGPNMAGKSTYMRQTALIVLMAQAGCFVPAESARIGVCDRIFTRIGASDKLAQGQSTFFGEMSELSYILKNAGPRSLIILDEIGRGTSTYDGLSIAWAVVEELCNDKTHIRTLFATHYHELTELENKVEGVRNYCVAVKEKGEDVIFLRKIIEGGADESYGVHVAKLAGIPNTVITRANTILKDLKESNIVYESSLVKKTAEEKQAASFGQFDLYNYKLGEIAQELKKIDLNELTPLDALNTLAKMKEKL